MNRHGFVGRACESLLFGWLLLAGLARAQGCQLVPVPLAERVREATVIVEAAVSKQQAEALPGGCIGTYSTLHVFAVLKGQPATPLRLLSPGGTVGLRREVVSGLGAPAVGQQGIFLLEPDPLHPGALRLAAGPQGMLTYDLSTLTAHDPFGRYPFVGADLYPTLAALTGQLARPVQPNATLAAARVRVAQQNVSRQRPTATPTISSFSPSAVTAGTSTAAYSSGAGVLTLNGSGFNAVRGTGYVAFRNADNGGAGTVQPLAGDYLAWSDTQIQVRVPSNSSSGNTAGTGPVSVINSDGSAATTAGSVTVTYALSTLDDSGQNYRIALVGSGAALAPGGYVLSYAAAVPTAARTAFQTALNTWRCQAGTNRTIGTSNASQTQAAQDNVNLVCFGSLPAGVLGVTSSYYTGCFRGSVLYWVLPETDYTFSNTANFYYGTGTPGSGQSDFQSVALHEQGHGIQLSHIISSTGVMNFALTTGTTRRTLDATTDLAAARDETTYSTSSANARCGFAAYTSVNCALPVEVVAFDVQAGAGAVQVNWATASEKNSRHFVVQRSTDGLAFSPIATVAAAGSSTSIRRYALVDTAPPVGSAALYYRLQQVDLDGSVTYSPVRSVSLHTAGRLALYPNPAHHTATLRLPAGTAPAPLTLTDALGRAVRDFPAPASSEAVLDLQGLPAGLYLLRGAGPTQRLAVE